MSQRLLAEGWWFKSSDMYCWELQPLQTDSSDARLLAQKIRSPDWRPLCPHKQSPQTLSQLSFQEKSSYQCSIILAHYLSSVLLFLSNKLSTSLRLQVSFLLTFTVANLHFLLALPMQHFPFVFFCNLTENFPCVHFQRTWTPFKKWSHEMAGTRSKTIIALCIYVYLHKDPFKL